MRPGKQVKSKQNSVSNWNAILEEGGFGKNIRLELITRNSTSIFTMVNFYQLYNAN